MFKEIKFNDIVVKFGSINNFLNLCNLGLNTMSEYNEFEKYIINLINIELENYNFNNCRLEDLGFIIPEKYIVCDIKIIIKPSDLPNSFDKLKDKKIHLAINSILEKSKTIYMRVNEHDIKYNDDMILLHIYCRIPK